MSKRAVTRRAFLGFAAAVSLVPVLGCPLRPDGKGVIVYRRSLKGMHGSRAGKKHAANHLYRTRLAAFVDKAHWGDHAKIVEVTINRDFFNRIFPFGKVAVDLRHIA